MYTYITFSHVFLIMLVTRNWHNHERALARYVFLSDADFQHDGRLSWAIKSDDETTGIIALLVCFYLDFYFYRFTACVCSDLEI